MGRTGGAVGGNGGKGPDLVGYRERLSAWRYATLDAVRTDVELLIEEANRLRSANELLVVAHANARRKAYQFKDQIHGLLKDLLA